jgi:hypothetical protein
MKFSLYSGHEESKEAHAGGVKLIEHFVHDFKHWGLKYQACGARDTAASDAFAREVAKAFGFVFEGEEVPPELCSPKIVQFVFSPEEQLSVRPGEIASTLKQGVDRPHLAGCVDGFEALILALASAGVDLSTPQMRAAVHTAYEAICEEHAG